MSIFSQNNCFADVCAKKNQQYENIKEKQNEEMIVLSTSSEWQAGKEAVNPAMWLLKTGVPSQQEESAKARWNQAGGEAWQDTPSRATRQT